MGQICPSCGQDNRSDARFCGRCAAALASDWRCEACGRENPADYGFCDGCGKPAPGREAAAAVPAREPRAYTPDHLAEKLLGARSTLAGERKQVTVLFADLTGSMDLAEQTDPEAFRVIMDRLFGLLCEGVHRFEGIVVTFTGDGIMALFGAPIAHEDHAARAAYAALHLGETLAEYASELRRERGVNFSVRMGLNSGEVIVGGIGEDLRVDYTAIGHTVGLAQRMESLAEPGKPYVTEDTAKILLGFFDLNDLGEFEIKGVRDPLHVYELLGIGRARSRLDIARARGFSRFVGRDDELGVLETALDHALAGDGGQIVGVVGEPGVGKSRLCHEFTERCRAKGLKIYHASGHAHAQNVPFLASLEMMRAYFDIEERDDAQSTRERIAGRLLLLEPAFADELPLVFDFLGVPDPERPAGAIDPEARHRRLLDFVRRLVHATGNRDPNVTLLEDLHWIDRGSETFLEVLVEALPGTRSLTIVNFRPEYHADWMGASYYHQMPLIPLGLQASGQLLDELLGGHPSLNGIHDEIRQRTGGNPFFIEELVQTLVEDGTLEGERGALRLARLFERVSVPQTVHAVLAARIDRLGGRDKALLQAAAVLGQEFGEPVLDRVAELSEPELAGALRALVAADFLYERALYPEAEYAFKHPLTREVAYGTQLGERRAALHAEVARAIADLYPERQDERAALIADHWEAAGDELEAMRWHARAAVWAGVNAPAEALTHWQRVRELTGTLDETPETIGFGIGARLWVLQMGWRLGIREDEAAQVYAEGGELARRAGDDASLALIMTTYAATVGVTGRMDDALEMAQEAIGLAERANAPGITMAALPFLAYCLFVNGRPHEALAAAERGIELSGGDPMLGAGIGLVCPLAWCVMARGYLSTQCGRLKVAAGALEEADRLAREHGDLETEGWTHMQWVIWARSSGQIEGALGHARQAIEIVERGGSAFSRVLGQLFLANALSLEADHEAAVEAAERALAMSEQTRTGREAAPWMYAVLAHSLLALGEPDRALAAATRGVELGGAHHLNIAMPWTHGIVADIALAAGDLERARLAVEEGLAADAANGGTVEEPALRLRLAELARLAGDAAGHEQHLREAHRMLVEFGATPRAEEAAALLAAISAPA